VEHSATSAVSLPETIGVKYTAEEVEYLNLRPITRQTFRIAELVDMIVGVTGKNIDRIQTLLRSGTVVFHSYRYWWEGFEAETGDLQRLLATFPGPDPSRVFRADECTEVRFEFAGSPPRPPVRLNRAVAGPKRWFQRRGLWERILEQGASRVPRYKEYAYGDRTDLFELPTDPAWLDEIRRDGQRYAARSLQPVLGAIAAAVRVVFVCPRAR
jgi:hypothetical protein